MPWNLSFNRSKGTPKLLRSRPKRAKRRALKLSSLAGRIVENTHFRHLGGWAIVILLWFAVYYRLAPPGNGIYIKDVNPTSWDDLYFSVVTFSSLGYGDVVPIGWGRAVAGLEVFCGLILLSLFVGKLASERQSTLIRLIYTSDHQRRITAFAKDLGALAEKLKNAKDDYDHELMLILATQIEDSISSLRPYLRFQSSEGSLLDFGNVSSLRFLYKSLVKITHECSCVACSAIAQEKTRKLLDRSIEFSSDIAESMLELHQNAPSFDVLKAVLSNVYSHNKRKFFITKGVFIREPGIVTENCLTRVRNSLPPPPWPTNVHVLVGKQLTIPNRHAVRCIEEIVRRDKASLSKSYVHDNKSRIMSAIGVGVSAFVVGYSLAILTSKKK